MRSFFLVLLFVVSSLHVRAEESEPKCLPVVSGSIVVSDSSGDKTEIKDGFYCPPSAATLVAKKFVVLGSEIKELKIKLSASEEKLTRSEKYTAEIDLIWENKVKEQDEKIAYLSGFWNKTGRILLWCGLTAVATTITIYGAEKAGVIKW